MKWMMLLALVAMMDCKPYEVLRGRAVFARNIDLVNSCKEALHASKHFLSSLDEDEDGDDNAPLSEEKKRAEIEHLNKGLTDCLTLINPPPKGRNKPRPKVPPADSEQSLANPAAPPPNPKAPPPNPKATSPDPKATSPNPKATSPRKIDL